MTFRRPIALLGAVLLAAGCEFALGLNDLELQEETTPLPPDTSGICESSHHYDNGVQDGCLNDKCCASFTPCLQDDTCVACINDASAPGCDNHAQFQAFFNCFWGSCAPAACGSSISLQGSPALNVCVTENCCSEFNACAQDGNCSACLQTPDANCNANPLYLPFAVCRNQACPPDLCDIGIVFSDDYYNDTADLIYGWQRCVNDNCCEPLLRCADPSMDGRIDGSDPEVEACLACIKDEGCASSIIQAAANEYSACFGSNQCGE